MRLPILDQFDAIDADQLPLIFASVAATALAIAVIVVFLTACAPVLVRDLRAWYRERKAELERTDRARMDVAVRTGDRRVW